MRKQGFDDESVLASWQTELGWIFPAVVEGDEIIGVSDSSESALLFEWLIDRNDDRSEFK
jgi:hypothetical protein